MFGRLVQGSVALLLAASRRWWAVLLAFLLNSAALLILFNLEDQFEALSGVPTFDTQNDLTQALIVEQLPRYQGDALAAYLRFAAFDFVFPLVGGIFIAVIVALLLRLNTRPYAQRLLGWGLPLLPLLTTGWDYLENVSLLAILTGGAAPTLMSAALLFKQLKLAFLSASGPLVIVLAALLAIDLIRRRQMR